MEPIRSFIAAELPDDLKLAISRLQERLKAGSRAPVKWVSPGSTHLTLRFLGNINAAMVDDIKNALGVATQGIPAIRLAAGGLGAFPDNKRVQVVWVGLTGELDKIRKLKQRIDEELASLGFKVEKRAFSPHLTIARLRDRATVNDSREMGELIEQTDFENNLEFIVNSVNLMKSHLTREGPVYSRLGSLSLD